jgi:integrase
LGLVVVQALVGARRERARADSRPKPEEEKFSNFRRKIRHSAKQALDEVDFGDGHFQKEDISRRGKDRQNLGLRDLRERFWCVVRRCCQRAGLEHIAPHDLRRTCAKLCHSNGGELEEIQFLLGHA